jgi:hypothetical protein
MNDRINAYANFISGQLVKEGMITEATKENSKITDAVAKHIGFPEDESHDAVISHVATHGNHHTYHVGESAWSYDGEPAHHVTHDAKTGKSYDFDLPPKKIKPEHVKKIMDKAVPGGVSAEHAKAVADDHNSYGE